MRKETVLLCSIFFPLLLLAMVCLFNNIVTIKEVLLLYFHYYAITRIMRDH